MPKSELTAAYEQLYEELKNDPQRQAFQPFFEAIKAADDAMSAMHKRDRYGRIPLLKAEDRERLLQLHEALGAATEKLLAEERIGKGRKDTVRKIAALAAANTRHLRAYDPKEPRSLPELLEDVRTRTLDAKNVKLDDTVGDFQSKRQLLSFADDNGKEISGVFTPAKRSDVWERLEKDFRHSAGIEKNPEAAAILNSFLEKLDSPQGALALELPEDASRSARLYTLMENVLGKAADADTAMGELIAKLYSTPEKPMTAEGVKEMFGGRMSWFTLSMRPEFTFVDATLGKAGVQDGTRIDSRNAAMSAVAELLGVPNVVAKSVPMKIVKENGQVEEGVFMKAASGVDISNLRDEDYAHKAADLTGGDNLGLKSLADLQILDFICGNTDRHMKNIAYQFDPVTGKLTGVQGYDNDTAFGDLIPEKDEYYGHMTRLRDMYFVSESMYKRLEALTPETLKFSLRGFGLTERELEAAGKRLTMVKEKIKADVEPIKSVDDSLKKYGIAKRLAVTDHIRIMRDQDWKDVKFDQLLEDHTETVWEDGVDRRVTVDSNIFSRTKSAMEYIASQEETRALHPYRPIRGKETLGLRNRANPAAVGEELKKAAALEQKLEERTAKGRSSGPYRDMQEAVRNYREFCKSLRTRIRNAEAERKLLPDPNEPQIIAPHQDQPKQEREPGFDPTAGTVCFADLQKMRELAEEIRRTAQDYLDTKPKPEKDYKKYTRKRIEAARELLSFGQERSVVRDEEIELASRNERRAVENENRREGDSLEKEARKQENLLIK